MLEMWGADLRRLWEEVVVGIDRGGLVDRVERVGVKIRYADAFQRVVAR